MPTIEDLQNQIDQIMEQIQSLKSASVSNPIQPYNDINFYPQLKVGTLIINYMESTAAKEPTIPANSIAIWKDTTNTKYYIKANFTKDSTHTFSGKVQLT